MKCAKKIAEEVATLLPSLIRHVSSRVSPPIDLPPTQLIALTILQDKEPIRLGALSKKMKVSAPTITGVVDRMEKSGLVRRVADFKDRRAVNIVITPKGLDAQRQFHMNLTQRWRLILSKIPQQQQQQMLKILQNIVKGFEYENK